MVPEIVRDMTLVGLVVGASLALLVILRLVNFGPTIIAPPSKRPFLWAVLVFAILLVAYLGLIPILPLGGQVALGFIAGAVLGFIGFSLMIMVHSWYS